MKMDIEKIKEIYGNSMLEDMSENIDTVKHNINYLHSINILDTNELVESYTPIFLYEEKEFENKINILISKLGPNYVDKIYDNLGVLEELL